MNPESPDYELLQALREHFREHPPGPDPAKESILYGYSGTELYK